MTEQAWIMAVDEMTVEQAREVGKILGSMGITGTFVHESREEFMGEYVRWRIAHKKGGGEDGEAVHQAGPGLARGPEGA